MQSESSTRILRIIGWSFYHEFFLFFGLIWVTVVAALKLDHHLSTWNDGAAIIPLLIGVLPLIAASIAYVVLYKIHANEGNKFEPFNRCIDSKEACVFISLCGTFAPFENGRFFISSSTACFSSWFLLLIIRLATASASFKWTIVFLPLWIWSLMTIIGFIFEYRTSNYGSLSTSVLGIIGCLLSGLFFILFGLKLDGYTPVPWHGVLTPLYLLNFYTLLVAGVFLESMRGKFSFGVKGTSMRWLLGLVPVAAFVIPLFVFEVLLAERLEGNTDTPFIIVFIPALVYEGLLAVCCMGASLYKCCSSSY